jgi:hypothetical protein
VGTPSKPEAQWLDLFKCYDIDLEQAIHQLDRLREFLDSYLTNALRIQDRRDSSSDDQSLSKVFPFDHFSGAKQRKLLQTLWQAGKVPFQSVANSVYGERSTNSQQALMTLISRTNRKLVEEPENHHEIRKRGETLELILTSPGARQ